MSENKKLCPLCGKENNCGYEKGSDHFSCWCTTTEVPKELREQIPEELKGKACICYDCIMKYKKEHQIQPI
ncbi:cysteine-rich CWC family protein [Clostridium sp. Marseille-P299]|uniref:cysteine-rich CWC family protein n=1 Tax=Clostridium sp. Marseille-P299 TaxID=1805477 RepID=UPI0008330E89|nr:cysteine-rich CWC family protein [Clostridium sp. Marseille-P299]